ncbi:MAG: hypothetical protein EZS28_031884, partial [Streblomastix strix]
VDGVVSDPTTRMLEMEIIEYSTTLISQCSSNRRREGYGFRLNNQRRISLDDGFVS